MVENQPLGVMSDAFASALLRGESAWPSLQFPTVRVLDRQNAVVASSVLTGLRVTDDGFAHADAVFLTNYVKGDSLMLVEINSQRFGLVVSLEIAGTVATPEEPFWLLWDARGIFRP